MPKRHRHGRFNDAPAINPATSTTGTARLVVGDPNGNREARRVAVKLAKRKATQR